MADHFRVPRVLLDSLIQRQGQTLFRWRSFLPLALVPAALVALADSTPIDYWFGETAEDVWIGFSMLVAYLGLAVRVMTVGFVPGRTSGRNTSEQRADSLNTTGMYSVVRNPLYLGNFLTLLGFAMMTMVWWFVVLVVLSFALYYERIILTEEDILRGKFGAVYEAWASKTPVFFPRLALWRRPEWKFSLRAVLRREHVGLYLIAVVSTLIEAGVELLGEGETLYS